MEAKDKLLAMMIEGDIKRLRIVDYEISDHHDTDPASVSVGPQELVYVYLMKVISSTSYSVKVVSSRSARNYTGAPSVLTTEDNNTITRHFTRVAITATGVSSHYYVSYVKLKYRNNVYPPTDES
ncbi:MAG: hypothetical protein KJ607_03195 [Bacteroidetes bacterium]|nr:hypothetical protein [Bacteroidota bacterium]